MRLNHGLPGRTELEQGAVGQFPPSTPPTACGNGVARGATTKRRRPRRHRPALVPATRPAHELAHRQRVQELVGHDQQRPIRRQAGQLVVPVHRQARQGRRLPLAQSEAGLDQMDRHRSPELGHHLRRSQGVGHQRAAPGPSSTRPAAGPAEIQPMLDQGQADQLAEQLAHLRRGDEIPGCPGIPARIVAPVGAPARAM